MYRWYQEAAICYAYLANVKTHAVTPEHSQYCYCNFCGSRWWSRSWCLQELLAPPILIFLNQFWDDIGTKSTLKDIVSAKTGIPTVYLLGGDLRDANVAQKMSWASRRAATRLEDRSYSLMGIFGVNMPLLYGEGERAFIRLQEEIIKATYDHSIFVWRLSDRKDEETSGPLAPSPDAFGDSRNVVSDDSLNSSGNADAILVNNRGVHLQARIISKITSEVYRLAVLPCRHVQTQDYVAIYVEALPRAKDYFKRVRIHRYKFVKPHKIGTVVQRTVCVQNGFPSRAKCPSSLSQAAACGNTKILKSLLQHDANPDSGLHEERLVLENAAMNGHIAAVRLLLDWGAKTESKDSIGDTPLVQAITHKHEDAVKLLLEHGAETKSETCMGDTPLRLAIWDRNKIAVKLLLENGVNPELLGKDGRTPLTYAIEIGDEDVLRLLLDAGAHLEARDSEGRTPLSCATVEGHASIARMLLDRGARIATKDKSGATPLWQAARRGHRDIANLLLANGADINASDSHGNTPLLGAAANGRQDIAVLLLQAGADLECKDEDGLTPLAWAAEANHPDMVRLLLEQGANPASRDRLGRTWLSRGNIKSTAIVRLLESYSKNGNMRVSEVLEEASRGSQYGNDKRKHRQIKTMHKKAGRISLLRRNPVRGVRQSTLKSSTSH